MKNRSTPTVGAHLVPGTERGAWEDEKVCTKDRSRARLLERKSSQIPRQRGLLGYVGQRLGKTAGLSSSLGRQEAADVPRYSGSFPAGSPGGARPERAGSAQETPGRKGSRGQRLRAQGLVRSTLFDPLQVAVSAQGPGFPGTGPNDPGGVHSTARGSEPCFCHLETVGCSQESPALVPV